MLKKIPNGYFQKYGTLFPKYTFRVGKYHSSQSYNKKQYEQFLEEQKTVPISLMNNQKTGQQYWAFQGEFYVESENYTAREIQALIFERNKKKERRVNKAVSLMEQERENTHREREPIPDEVKIFVWNRDGGKCVKCGSKENLEFDHIIPFSLGGSNTARNLQLLCESCNRAKSNSLA